MAKDGPVIAEIRATRSRISASVDHDPKKLAEYYIKFQEKYRDRLLNPDGTKRRALKDSGADTEFCSE